MDMGRTWWKDRPPSRCHHSMISVHRCFLAICGLFTRVLRKLALELTVDHQLLLPISIIIGPRPNIQRQVMNDTMRAANLTRSEQQAQGIGQ